MLGAVFKIMWLRLWRDRGALILAFVLPGFIFAIFAAIFSNAAGGDLDIRVAMAITTNAPDAAELSNKLQNNAGFSLSFDPDWDADEVRERVRLGQDDVGFILRGPLANPEKPGLVIISEPGREVAATILRGRVQEVLTADQSANMPKLFETQSAMESAASDGPEDQSVSYYVGATAILFLLFSAMQGASITLDERKNGISDRLLLGAKGALGLLSGKFLFLTLIGTLQAAVIVIIAELFFGVPAFERAGPIVLACAASASLASALGLLVASLCKTAAQMNTVSTFAVLLFSAVGGSMVPRFMMPEWLQGLGLFTPNHWAIEGFYGLIARSQTVTELWLVWLVQFGGAAVCLIFAAFLSHRLMRT